MHNATDADETVYNIHNRPSGTSIEAALRRDGHHELAAPPELFDVQNTTDADEMLNNVKGYPTGNSIEAALRRPTFTPAVAAVQQV